jgi:FixJ family two-component response regulator
MLGELSRKERQIAEDVARGHFSVIIRDGFDIIIP